MPKPDTPKRRRPVVAGQRRLRAQAPPAPPAAPPAAPHGPPPSAPAAKARPARRHRSSRAGLRAGLARLRPGAGRRLTPTALVATLAAAAIVLGSVGGWQVFSWQHGRAVAAAKSDAVAAARTALTSVLSYNYATIDADTARAERYLTGAFRTEYHDTTQRTVRDAAIRYKASVSADVVYAGAITASPHRATVLLFVDQTAKNTLLKAPRIDRNRIRVDMKEVSGRWLVSKLTLL